MPHKTREARAAYWRNRDLNRRYGITAEQWDDLFDAQGRKCAICRRSEANRWHTDHCHDTGVVRGILCWGCNKSLGHFGDTVDGLMTAVQYLKEAHAGIPVSYSGG